ncbi:hypothetical protein [Nocardioides massiliensis]|uniref:MinD-like ATPase involved in chromosome partitioning or flagellar assembly n=1 Tax=Nocardioides massiliensis TaxID=1325935 RepID=A0ABT9NUQ5_9ACTN|nr:hypothetical protein [Nocardioides massiliensis]MDP9824166.1 MinD-like ATPase involved in chromosome partitioning or flagellar assembly [Nocardioides massiliensis]
MDLAGPGNRVAVVLAAAGAAWESAALAALGRSRDAVVLKRCVDLPDLLATVETGRVRVAVLDADLGGVDAAAVSALRARRVVPAAVTADPVAASRMRAVGIDVVIDPEETAWAQAVSTAAADVTDPDPADAWPAEAPAAPELPEHPVVAVWSPPGAPGRTTVAVALAAYVARTRACVLVDADPVGGAVGQHLAVLDDVSGLLAAARLVNQGQLDDERFAAALRAVELRTRGVLEVLTGLPRPDRWAEVREGVATDVLDRARRRGVVVVDAGVRLGVDPERRARSRDDVTREVVEAADVNLVVAAPDAVGLARLSRSLVAHTERGHTDPGRTGTLHVVVNRMRPGVGWGEHQVRAMVEGFVGPVSLSFLPDDQAGADRALAEGRAVGEAGEGPLAAAVADLAGALGLVAGRHRPARRRRERRRFGSA